MYHCCQRETEPEHPGARAAFPLASLFHTFSSQPKRGSSRSWLKDLQGQKASPELQHPRFRHQSPGAAPLRARSALRTDCQI